jgi:thiol-disulfide isomerase/thioredoxin
MKKTIILILLVSILFSCNKQEKKDYVIFSGQIKNTKEKSLTIRGNPALNNELLQKISLDKKGIFSDTIQITKSGLYYFIVGKDYFRIYFTEGDDVKLTFDVKNYENTKFTGLHANDNDYLFKQRYELDGHPKVDNDSLTKLSEKEFLEALNILQKQNNEKVITANLSKSFLPIALSNIHYGYLIDLANYEIGHMWAINDKSFRVSDSFPQEEPNFDYNNLLEYENSGYYISLFSIYIGREWEREFRENKNITYLDITNKKVSNTTIKNNTLFKEFRLAFTTSKNRKHYYDSFMKYSSNEEHKKVATEMYEEMLVLNAGNPSPKFVNYENYEGGTSSLDDFKGKFVYIDVWATWCGPCVGEIPFLAKIEKKYHKKNIVFVSISADDKTNVKAWRKLIEKKKMKGVQLITDKAFESDFVQNYKINGIPHFILIDPKGNIVEASAPRPSDPELIDLFKKAGVK